MSSCATLPLVLAFLQHFTLYLQKKHLHFKTSWFSAIYPVFLWFHLTPGFLLLLPLTLCLSNFALTPFTIIWLLLCFMLCHSFLKLSFCLLILFSFGFNWVYVFYLVFQIWPSSSFNLLLISSCLFLLLDMVFFISYCFLFIVSVFFLCC